MREPKQPNLRILVADDEPTILDLFKDVLCPETSTDGTQERLQDLRARLFPDTQPSVSVSPFDVVMCRQGDEAVERVRTALAEDSPFAVAFLDMRMPPGPDGLWTAEQIRQLDPSVQIVIVTAYSDVDPIEISRQVEPPDKLLYVQKPFYPHEIQQFAFALASKWVTERELREQTIRLERSNEQLRQEIAEHKRAQRQRHLLARAVMSTDDSIYVTDMENRIMFVNPAFCRTYGYREEEILGEDADVLWSKGDSACDGESSYQENGGGEVAFVHKRKDDSRLAVSLSEADVEDASGATIATVIITRDISEHMKTESQLQSEIARLSNQQISTRKGVANASKQLRQELDAIRDILCTTEQNLLEPSDQDTAPIVDAATTHIDKAIRIVECLDEVCEAEPVATELELEGLVS
jgi:PAS domain S-box-containing protein